MHGGVEYCLRSLRGMHHALRDRGTHLPGDGNVLGSATRHAWRGRGLLYSIQLSCQSGATHSVTGDPTADGFLKNGISKACSICRDVHRGDRCAGGNGVAERRVLQ